MSWDTFFEHITRWKCFGMVFTEDHFRTWGTPRTPFPVQIRKSKIGKLGRNCCPGRFFIKGFQSITLCEIIAQLERS